MLYAFGGTNTYRSFIRQGGARLPDKPHFVLDNRGGYQVIVSGLTCFLAGGLIRGKRIKQMVADALAGQKMT